MSIFNEIIQKLNVNESTKQLILKYLENNDDSLKKILPENKLRELNTLFNVSGDYEIFKKKMEKFSFFNELTKIHELFENIHEIRFNLACFPQQSYYYSGLIFKIYSSSSQILLAEGGRMENVLNIEGTSISENSKKGISCKLLIDHIFNVYQTRYKNKNKKSYINEILLITLEPEDVIINDGRSYTLKEYLDQIHIWLKELKIKHEILYKKQVSEQYFHFFELFRMKYLVVLYLNKANKVI